MSKPQQKSINSGNIFALQRQENRPFQLARYQLMKEAVTAELTRGNAQNVTMTNIRQM